VRLGWLTLEIQQKVSVLSSSGQSRQNYVTNKVFCLLRIKAESWPSSPNSCDRIENIVNELGMNDCTIFCQLTMLLLMFALFPVTMNPSDL
jgi:hypothetical protein